LVWVDRGRGLAAHTGIDPAVGGRGLADQFSLAATSRDRQNHGRCEVSARRIRDKPMFDGFEKRRIDTATSVIAVRVGGSGPAVLLLHGFPETQLMWRGVAGSLADDFTVVCADLPGYGESGCPPSSPDHEPYSKRAMAKELVDMMIALGHERFAVVGHDRGGRVAYRAALDHADRILAIAALDVVPIDEAWRRADDRLALGFWPWSLLAQHAPLPERLLSAAPDAVVDDALNEWGSLPKSFDDEVRAAYVEQLRDRDHVHAICEEYRAAATIDRDHDAEDRHAGRRVRCPALLLWAADGALATWYTEEGGPLTIWRDVCETIEGHPIDGGHFFPEEHPNEVAAELAQFLQPLSR
jgi:haloacetate dehalogenase